MPSISELWRENVSLTAELVVKEREITKLNEYVATLAARVSAVEIELAAANRALFQAQEAAKALLGYDNSTDAGGGHS